MSLRGVPDEPDAKVRRLNLRFRRASGWRRQRYSPRRHSWRCGLRTVLFIFAGGLILAAMIASSPAPLPETLRHIAIIGNCDDLRAMGLAPARRGEPGYRSRLDADHDGIACEVWHPYRNRLNR